MSALAYQTLPLLYTPRSRTSSGPGFAPTAIPQRPAFAAGPGFTRTATHSHQISNLTFMFVCILRGLRSSLHLAGRSNCTLCSPSPAKGQVQTGKKPKAKGKGNVGTASALAERVQNEIPRTDPLLSNRRLPKPNNDKEKDEACKKPRTDYKLGKGNYSWQGLPAFISHRRGFAKGARWVEPLAGQRLTCCLSRHDKAPE